MELGRVPWLRERPFVGPIVSITLHLALIAALVLFGAPFANVQVKRGEPLFVELPDIPEPAPAGSAAAKLPGPAMDRPARAVVKPPSAPRPAPPRPAPAVVASVQTRSAPPSSPPVPRASQPEPSRPSAVAPPADVSDAANASAAKPAASPEATPSAPPAPPQDATTSPHAESAPRLAAIPPGADTSPPVDIRSALRRGGGAGGMGNGRGGIEGEPIPLDSPDPRYSDYFDRVRRMIKDHWGYPCVKNGDTRECEYKTAALIVEFGIAKDGKVPFVNVLRSSGWAIYDDYAVNAIKLAAPFPPVPDGISRKGIPVVARFNYVVDTSLTNFLR